MEENKIQQKPSWMSPRNMIIGVVVILATIGLYLFQSGTFFKASLLDLTSVPAFNGTVMPVQKTLDWIHLTSSEYTDFKAGNLSYATAGNKLIDIMAYAPSTLCSNDPTKLAWTGNDLNIRNLFLTYVTVYMGKYTSGATTACEGDGSHPAIDIRAPKGTPVYAIANGMASKIDAGGSSGNGNVVCITHPNVPSLEDPNTKTTYVSCYLHMDSIMTGLTVGSIVHKGDQIGVVGETGLATTWHLHFQLDKSTAPYHPYWPFTSSQAQTAGLNFFDGVNAGLGKENGMLYTVDPLAWVQKYMTYNQTASAGTGDSNPSTNSTPLPVNNNQNTTPTTTTNTNLNSTTAQNKNENTNNTPPTNINASVDNTNINTGSTVNTGSFTDVPTVNPYYDAIQYLKSQNIISGNPDGTFGPGNTINRAALAKILVEAKYSGQATGGNCFSDVKEEWFAPYICFAKEKGIVSGYDDGTFKPNNNVSFVEAAKMISVALGYSTGSSPTIPWYQMFVDILGTKKAIPTTITGFNQQITRGEMAEIMYRLLANITNKTSHDFTYLLQNGV
jgi:hypothetical protein